MCSDCDDRQLGRVELLASLLHRGESVQFGRLHVHQHEIVVRGLDDFGDGEAAVSHAVDGRAGIREQGSDDLVIDVIVFGNECRRRSSR